MWTAPAGHPAHWHSTEYSIGWPVEERTQGGLAQLREPDWTGALDAHGNPDPNTAVAELTGILRHGPDGDRMSSWPTDVRVIARRVPRPPGEQAKLGEDANWRYGAFATNTTSGQLQWLDVRHRTQTHVEDKVKELKTVGAENLPSKDWDRNSSWLQLAGLAASLNGWLPHLALDGDLAKAEPKTLRFRLLGAPARHVTHARTRIGGDPTRLGLGRRRRHRVGTAPSPAPRLNTNPPAPTNSTTPPARGTGAGPSTSDGITMPDGQIRASAGQN